MQSKNKEIKSGANEENNELSFGGTEAAQWISKIKKNRLSRSQEELARGKKESRGKRKKGRKEPMKQIMNKAERDFNTSSLFVDTFSTLNP